MKPDIHPEYRQVMFRDVSCDFEFVTRSTVQTKQTGTFEGKEYPLVVLDISSESHPFYTGTQKILDTAGRVEKFYRKYGFKKEDEPEDEVSAEPARVEAAEEAAAEAADDAAEVAEAPVAAAAADDAVEE